MEQSVWTKHLNSNNDDEYSEFKNKIAMNIEESLAIIIKDLMDSDLGYNYETAKKMAINLAMEQLLAIQYIHTPSSQKAMVISIYQKLF